MKIDDLLREAGAEEPVPALGTTAFSRYRTALGRRRWSRRPYWLGLGAVAVTALILIMFTPIPEPPVTASPVSSGTPVVREIVTDFYALDAAAISGVPDGYVMRVRVPRGTMASFGLPGAYESAESPIDADIVVSNNGAARAIRFVRLVPVSQ